MSSIGWLPAHRVLPAAVRLGTTTRHGGVSRGGCEALNLATSVSDAPEAVAENRNRLRAALNLPSEPLWLKQVHGIRVHVDDGRSLPTEPCDAAVTAHPDRVLAILTADCLPVALMHRDGLRLGLAHAGWRGLAAGVIEATLTALESPASEVIAWLGPAIGSSAFEVGDDVRAAFLDQAPEDCLFFAANARGRWQADLAALARARLGRLGVTDVVDCGECTHSQPDRFYSHRRDPQSGRQATLLWRHRQSR